MSEDPDKTPILCPVCEGKPTEVQDNTIIKQYTKYKVIKCRWCINGSMNEERYNKWRAWRRKQKKP